MSTVQPSDEQTDNRDLVELGRRLRAAREASGLSIRRLAERVGVHHSSLARIEAVEFEKPSYATLRRLAVVLEIDEADLLALAGYTTSDLLPALPAYLRAKYDLPPEAAAQLSDYFDYLAERYGISQSGDSDRSSPTITPGLSPRS